MGGREGRAEPTHLNHPTGAWCTRQTRGHAHGARARRARMRAAVSGWVVEVRGACVGYRECGRARDGSRALR